MIKMENIKGIYEISGFGKKTSYEKGCQNMLQSGYEWLVKQDRKCSLSGDCLKDVVGILIPTTDDAKKLSEHILNSEPDCSGAMHEAVMGHLFFINENGIAKWKNEVAKH